MIGRELLYNPFKGQKHSGHFIVFSWNYCSWKDRSRGLFEIWIDRILLQDVVIVYEHQTESKRDPTLILFATKRCMWIFIYSTSLEWYETFIVCYRGSKHGFPSRERAFPLYSLCSAIIQKCMCHEMNLKEIDTDSSGCFCFSSSSRDDVDKQALQWSSIAQCMQKPF